MPVYRLAKPVAPATHKSRNIPVRAQIKLVLQVCQLVIPVTAIMIVFAKVTRRQNVTQHVSPAEVVIYPQKLPPRDREVA